MTVIQTQTTGGRPLDAGTTSSLALDLTNRNQSLGVLDVGGLVQDVVQLAVSAPAQVATVLHELGGLVSAVDLSRLTAALPHTVARLGDVVGGLGIGSGPVLGNVADLATRVTTPLSQGVSRAADGLNAAVGAATSQMDPGASSLARGLPSGAGDWLDRTSGPFGVATGVSLSPSVVAEAPLAVAASERSATIGRNEATWTLDGKGRPIRAEATLREVFTDLERSSAETKAQEKAADRGVDGDHGGHIIGHRFVKDQGLDNLFPQNGDFNLSAYKTVENEMADWVEAGAEVRVTVDLLGGGDRPVRVRVAYEVTSGPNGDVIYDNNVLFRNAADQTFDRVPSSDMTDLLNG